MSRVSRCSWGVALAVVLAISTAPAFAQEASLAGLVSDSSGGVLPGVTITAVHAATGNTFTAVTDAVGAFRMPVRTGMYTITAELPGFSTVNRRVEVLVGQTADLRLEMSVSTVQETVTVTGEAPLVDTTGSQVRSVVDSRQMEDLPVNGRSWLDLALLSAGARTNASQDTLGFVPAAAGTNGTTGSGYVQINVDGFRVTQDIASAVRPQPKYSRDAIAQFEVISNRFDATQGGAMEAQINAITKSGTNSMAGTFSGYFRDDSLIGKDFVANRVLPYSDQQLSATLGGPIRRDRIHYFGNFEYERSPRTVVYNSVFPRFNPTFGVVQTNKIGGGRVDTQFSPAQRLSVRGSWYEFYVPQTPAPSGGLGGALEHPSRALDESRHSGDLVGTMTSVMSNNLVNTVIAGYGQNQFANSNTIPDIERLHPQGVPGVAPTINLRGYGIGSAFQSPQDIQQKYYSIKDSLQWSFAKAGRHDVRLGAEFRHLKDPLFICYQCGGVLDATGGPIPANIQDLFPVADDPSTWNIRALAPIVNYYEITLGSPRWEMTRDTYSGWLQDDWRLNEKLTLNLGLRYDVIDGAFGEDFTLPGLLPERRPLDKDNIAPRVGFAYSLRESTVLRGGYGLFYSDPGELPARHLARAADQMLLRVQNDGRPDFPVNPFNGPAPTVEQARQRLCMNNGGAPGCLRPNYNLIPHPESSKVAYSHQGSIGMQQQLSSTLGVQVDYTFSLTRDDVLPAGNVDLNHNISFNPATGANYPFADVTKRPFPDFGAFTFWTNQGKTDYHALQVNATKRFSDRWQAQASYTLAASWTQQAPPITPGCQYVWTISASGAPVCNVPVDLAPDFREEMYLTGTQRNRATFNGIWEVGYGVQLSGLYIYGDQGKATPFYAVDLRGEGHRAGQARLRPDGTFVERNSFDMPSIHRVDMRLQKRFTFGRINLDGLAEVFNVFNRTNIGSFVINSASAAFGRPQTSDNVAFWPRTVQLGFRASF